MFEALIGTFFVAGGFAALCFIADYVWPWIEEKVNAK